MALRPDLPKCSKGAVKETFGWCPVDCQGHCGHKECLEKCAECKQPITLEDEQYVATCSECGSKVHDACYDAKYSNCLACIRSKIHQIVLEGGDLLDLVHKKYKALCNLFGIKPGKVCEWCEKYLCD
jgi:hypothetical protein